MTARDVHDMSPAELAVVQEAQRIIDGACANILRAHTAMTHLWAAGR